MNFKTVLLIGIILLVLAGGYVWFFIYNKPKPNIEEKKPDYSLTVSSLVNEFKANHDSATKKYLDKVIELSGEVKTIEPNDSISSIVFNSGDEYEIYCEVYPHYNDSAKKLASPQKITLKGLFVGAEKPDETMELPGVLRLKKSSFKRAE